MEQSCNFLLYMIKMERQDTAYIELRVEIHHEDIIKESDSPHQTLSFLLNYTTGQKFGIFGKHNGNSHIWYLKLLQVAWHQPQDEFDDINVTPICSVIGDKRNLQCPDKDIHRKLQKCIIFNISHKISHSFQVYNTTWWIYENIVWIQ